MLVPIKVSAINCLLVSDSSWQGTQPRWMREGEDGWEARIHHWCINCLFHRLVYMHVWFGGRGARGRAGVFSVPRTLEKPEHNTSLCASANDSKGRKKTMQEEEEEEEEVATRPAVTLMEWKQKPGVWLEHPAWPDTITVKTRMFFNQAPNGSPLMKKEDFGWYTSTKRKNRLKILIKKVETNERLIFFTHSETKLQGQHALKCLKEQKLDFFGKAGCF